MKSIVLVPGLLAAALLTTGCGDLSIGDKVQVNLDVERQTAQLTVEMSDGLQINMLNGSYPIADGKGQLIFVPATKTQNARIGVEVNLTALAAGQLAGIGTVSTLPNGSPLPVAMTAPLLSIPAVHNNNFAVDALLAVTPELQIGATVGIAQMNTKYIPGGISVCQNFRNDQNVAFAAICLYGPGENKSGGVFVGANFGDVFNFSAPEIEDSNSMMLFAATAPQARMASSFSPISMSSTKYSMHKFDPKKDLDGSRGQKTLRNVQKILSVR